MPRQKHQTGLNLVQYGDGGVTKKYEEVMKKSYANKRGNIAKLQLQLQVGRLLYSPFLQPPTHPEKVVLSSNFYLNFNPNFKPNHNLNLNLNLNLN